MCLDPLGGQVLHHECISVIVSRFTTFTKNFVICCYQITHIFCTVFGSASPSPARGPCDFCPLADLVISVFREVSINTVFTQIRTSRKRGLWRWFMRRTGVWVSVFRNTVIHKIFSLAAIPVCRSNTGLPVPVRDSCFYLVWGFWLAQSTAAPPRFQKSTGLSVRNLSHTGLTVLVWPHESLPQLKMSWLVR